MANSEPIQFEGHETPNLSTVTQGAKDALYLVANVREIEGGANSPAVLFRSLNASFSS
ncbi:hypothetical protein [Chengkuizengella axinellae]|uniref:Uncharacterized protein n=1 Tax=Chengkuizengella axinellae TaxID=3064388 RepID=A0ABT9IYK5_9BACL|nr:hypothetical protein [Chengkuizengella sp. 2205SS18-9]MDP5274232.1 hypothetical protein [Chengkuizengella sp. 2205SS18-9]